MKLIPLTRGLFVRVDDWNYEKLNQWNWCAQKGHNTYYAARYDKDKYIYMHRIIMNTPNDMECDHQDGDGLNCLEENLRNCTHKQNLYHQRSTKNSTSKYLGVCKDKKRFKAQISVDGINHNLGRYNVEEDAARAYDKAAKQYFGEFANLNFPDE